MKIKGNSKENLVYSGTTIGNLMLGLKEKGGNILFTKVPGVHDLSDLYFTPNLSKAEFFAYRNYLNDRKGRAIVLEGPWPKNYNLDPNQSREEAFITREPFKINNFWMSPANLTNPHKNVIELYKNFKNLPKFKRNVSELTDLDSFKKILKLHR